VSIAHKAQSPYSVNLLAAIAVRAAVEDTSYLNHYVDAGAGRARAAVSGLRRAPHPGLSEPGEFRAVPRRRAVRCRFATRCASAACWCATAATRSPAACASPPARPSRWNASSSARRGVDVKPMIIFDMDGVLAEVSESYREAIVADRAPLHGRHGHARAHSGIQEPGRLQQRLAAVAAALPRPWRRTAVRDCGRLLLPNLLRREQRRPDQPRAWIPATACWSGSPPLVISLRSSRAQSRSGRHARRFARGSPSIRC
jgi:hypothetical protein